MITYQNRRGKVRAIVRRTGVGSKSKTFPTKGLAKTWAALDIIRRQPLTSKFIFPFKSDSIGNAFTLLCLCVAETDARVN